MLSGADLETGKSIARLSGGRELLTDNPANYAIYEKLEAHIRSMNAGIRNTQDMISYYRFMDATFETVTDTLQRIRELALRRSNSLLSDFDRSIIDGEMLMLYEHIRYTLSQAEFNRVKIFADLLESEAFKDLFADERYYILGNIDRMLNFFLSERANIGASANRLQSQIRSQMMEVEQTVSFQTRGDTDFGVEVSNFYRQHLKLTVNILLLETELKR
jgi:flagellin-like hook-associated protein FlgL